MLKEKKGDLHRRFILLIFTKVSAYLFCGIYEERDREKKMVKFKRERCLIAMEKY